ncbi:hypothetical protein HER10_EVM0012836 [Colletotrichum scovillei]|uniref:Uncharacterized protein n=1 Tax=Colletotrichum scovillei TaxID=1209932 RepID=A0A9P7R6W4_9PEZI|nr:uncharacterized protein HER10_EVM0012836 [Colletotrichum scovillei]KAF4774422.1 hypothetical protein HER10_EVM0012836 [Colletotrichum scovillei]KAG7048871.1 hypothetical protein JMJ77_0014500 [Colletotrichum scovillei]KAG7066033.1 hypothetical protein JMJ78_0012772 [Colletotrichum scovillei]KAG7068639.1 hypothetical protein JMJ76_0008321 [Colletotrichum scovillei]
MASLGRSFKPPAYLRARSRPAMTGRTLSSSSDISVVSTGSRSDADDLLMSGLNTPAYEKPKSGQDGFRMSTATELCSPKGESSAPCLLDLSALQSARYNRTRSIPLDPSPTTSTLRKINSAPACTPTPPDPLSARGDLSGGYFSFHEDPKGSTSRLHPQSTKTEGRLPRHKAASLTVDSSLQADLRGASRSAAMAPSIHLSPMSAADPSGSSAVNTPVTSYIPSGVHDTSLPMGKYYPSNYERNSSQDGRIGPSGPPSRVSSTRSEGHIPTREAFRSSSRQDSEVRRKLQQYQRDMIAQARLAASEVLGSSPGQVTAAVPSSTITLNGVPLTSLHHIGSTGVHKPISPRLLPLGSPGPVTPMDLEGGLGQSGYLDRGRNDEIARVLRAEEDRIRREGATSPAVEAGPQVF